MNPPSLSFWPQQISLCCHLPKALRCSTRDSPRVIRALEACKSQQPVLAYQHPVGHETPHPVWSHPLYIPKSTRGPGTDALERGALAVEALAQLWSCSRGCAGPAPGGACAEICSHTSRDQGTVSPFPIWTLPDPANAFLVLFVPFLICLTPVLLCCRLVWGFFQPDFAFGSGFVGLSHCRRTNSLTYFCLLPPVVPGWAGLKLSSLCAQKPAGKHRACDHSHSVRPRAEQAGFHPLPGHGTGMFSPEKVLM